MKKHGELLPGGMVRWCVLHGIAHGRFYLCEHFSDKILRRIVRERQRHLRLSASAALMLIFLAMLLLLTLSN